MAKTILIIEDEASIQNIVRAFLEDAGYTVYAAGDGLEGIEIFRRCNPDPVSYTHLVFPGFSLSDE